MHSGIEGASMARMFHIAEGGQDVKNGFYDSSFVDEQVEVISSRQRLHPLFGLGNELQALLIEELEKCREVSLIAHAIAIKGTK